MSLKCESYRENQFALTSYWLGKFLQDILEVDRGPGKPVKYRYRMAGRARTEHGPTNSRSNP